MRRSTIALAVVGVLAVAEIAVIVWVAGEVGVWWTLLLLLATGVLGGLLWRREGMRAWASLRDARDRPDEVGRRVTDAGLVLVGGLLLMLPGFITDVLGVLCLLPFTRPLARRGVRAALDSISRPYREQADLMRAKLDPDSVVPGEAAPPEDDKRKNRRRGPDDPTVIRGEIEP